MHGFFRNYSWILLVLILAALLFGTSLLPQPQGSYPEITELQGKAWAFQDYATYFRHLSEDKGAPYAYEVLKRAPFPPGIDLHLLGHIVGDMLYKQQGIAGIKLCTQDFRNACSHSVVIGILNEHGVGALQEIADTCKEAPGGRGAYTMCFHGLGHGVLAYNEYDLEKAVLMCKKTGTEEYQNREYIECVGGTIMEMIAGVHDRMAWEKQAPRFLKESDPLYPCDAAFMPQEARGICYNYLTPHLFTSAGGDLNAPGADTFSKAFPYCDKIPASDPASRSSCYGGFGKEFVVLAQGRDIRRIDELTPDKLQLVRSWCALAGNTEGETSCNGAALASLFWGGENNPDASFSFCSLASGSQIRPCYEQLASHITFYFAGSNRVASLCARIPKEYQGACASGRSAP